jgi:hypothetical protein
MSVTQWRRGGEIPACFTISIHSFAASAKPVVNNIHYFTIFFIKFQDCSGIFTVHLCFIFEFLNNFPNNLLPDHQNDHSQLKHSV